ncbi:MAG: AraC family transcriptional regulator [Gammaproteobacteria bacterium]|nr:AraC family transcriptional regulator [Gammaproteobacteria bacterium]
MCEQEIYIKNMVCDRCKMVVEHVLSELNLQPVTVQMGKVQFEKCLSVNQKNRIKESIEPLGFELIEGRQQRLIETIKIELINFVNANNADEHMNISDYLGNTLKYDYGHLSNMFSISEGISIEQYVINYKVEKVKELLILDQQSLTEISYCLGYSSLPHLSTQFKKVTGQTPSDFRRLKDAGSRISLDKL